MTIRTTVAVVLAMAILGASLPAIETARVQHADARVTAELDRLERAATALSAENDAVDDPPATARLTLHLPEESWGTRGLARLTVPRSRGGPDVTWTVAGGRNRTRAISSLELLAPEGFALRTGGRHRVVLELRERRGERVVIVRRTGALRTGVR